MMMMSSGGVKNRSPFKATKIWNQLLRSFKEGMELKRKRWRLKSYDNCFSGAEALDWLHSYLQNHPTFGAHVSKEQAFMLLQKFLDSNVFLHAVPVKNPKKFQDTNCLYKFEDIDENKKENERKPSKQEKENLPPLNSISGVLKNFTRRNSRNISAEDYQGTPLEEVVESNKSQSTEKRNENCMTPLALNLDSITVSSIEKGYADMSTILFDLDDEDCNDPFDTSISHFKRSNSLRVNNRYNDENHKAHITNLFSAKPTNDLDNIVSKKVTKKRAVLRKFAKGSPHLRDNSRRHTVTLGKRQGDSTNVVECSPTKKMKQTIVRSDSNLANAGYRTSLLPRKAVVMLGEKPSVINGGKDGNQLLDCKAKKNQKVDPQKPKKHTKLSKHKSYDHKEAHLNPLLTQHCPNLHTEVSINQKLPVFVPMCSADDLPTSPVLTAVKKKPSTYPSRRRSLSHNSLPLQVKSQSIHGLDSINAFNLLRKSKLHSSHITVNQRGLYKASSTWSINNIGVMDEASEMEHKNITHCNEISTEDIEDAWKSVVMFSLKKLLGVDSLSHYINRNKISGDVIMKNINWKPSELTRDAPEWLISAMQCLIEWPSTAGNPEDGVLQDLPNYRGFERDVYRTIKDHYQSSLQEPLIPCHMYPLLQECSEMMCIDVTRAISVLQHINVLLPSWNRRQLQLLVRFMHKVSANDELEISRDLPNKDLIIHSYYRLIARRTQQMIILGCQDTIAVRVSAFLIEHYEDVFKAPSNLRVQVDHKIAVTLGAPSFVRVNEARNMEVRRPCSAEEGPRRLKKNTSFCVQISKEEYQREAKELSKQAIRDLLTSILNDKYLTEKERKKRLSQIHKAYPELYSEQVSSADDVSYCSSTVSPQSMTENFKRAAKPSLFTEKML